MTTEPLTCPDGFVAVTTPPWNNCIDAELAATLAAIVGQTVPTTTAPTTTTTVAVVGTPPTLPVTGVDPDLGAWAAILLVVGGVATVLARRGRS